MRQQILSLTAAALMTVSGVAAAEISANVAFTNDYAFRGISQTDESFAVQGGFDYEHASGFYAGTWASNVDFAGSSELDLYVGYGFALSDSLSLDFNALYFYYPGQHRTVAGADSNFFEFTPALSYDGDAFSAGVGVSYSPDYFFESDESFYYGLDVGVPLSEALELGLHVGYQTIDDNAQFGTPDYTDWSVSLGTGLHGLDVSVAYVDTDLDSSECFGGSDLCDARGIVTVGKSF